MRSLNCLKASFVNFTFKDINRIIMDESAEQQTLARPAAALSAIALSLHFTMIAHDAARTTPFRQ
jgi:hypothetical protein